VIDAGLHFAEKNSRREFTSLISNNPFKRQAILKLSRGTNIENKDRRLIIENSIFC